MIALITSSIILYIKIKVKKRVCIVSHVWPLLSLTLKGRGAEKLKQELIQLFTPSSKNLPPAGGERLTPQQGVGGVQVDKATVSIS